MKHNKIKVERKKKLEATVSSVKDKKWQRSLFSIVYDVLTVVNAFKRIDNKIFPFKNSQEQIKSKSDSINFTLSRLFPYNRMKVFFSYYYGAYCVRD